MMLCICQSILVLSEANIHVVSNEWLHYLFERFPWFGAVGYNISIPWMVVFSGLGFLGSNESLKILRILPSAKELRNNNLSCRNLWILFLITATALKEISICTCFNIKNRLTFSADRKKRFDDLIDCILLRLAFITFHCDENKMTRSNCLGNCFW